MSEFECRNGHSMKGHRECPECGERCYTMDGMTASELRREERLDAQREQFKHDESEEG